MAKTVWGSGPFTSDSSLCAAAVHTGAIPATGGAIWATVGAGAASYNGTDRNGIRSRDFGAYRTSGIILSAPTIRTLSAELKACPANMTGVTASLHCHCAPIRFKSTGIYGTGTYTNDSNLCTAALHSGVVSNIGGPVSVRPIPDPGRYVGTVQNGVTSRDYGAWRGAFEFLR